MIEKDYICSRSLDMNKNILILYQFREIDSWHPVPSTVFFFIQCAVITVKLNASDLRK